MKQILLFIFSLCLVLFVLVPAAYIFLGRIDNPLSIVPQPGIVPTYQGSGARVVSDRSGQRTSRGDGAGRGESAQDGVSSQGASVASIFDAWKGASGDASASDERTCAQSATAFESPVRDAKLVRDGEQSVVSSKGYGYQVVLEGPVYDWKYTNNALKDESVSFVFDEKIIHILARSAKPECMSVAKDAYRQFHASDGGVEYFSSRTYLDEVKKIGVSRAILNTFGTEKINGKAYYWYELNEQFAANTDQSIKTMWFSVHVGRTEYWFGFSGYDEGGVFLKTSLDEFARNFLKSITFDALL
jgi:hypothetical protein